MQEGDAKHLDVNNMEKRLHFKAASENIKLIVCHESARLPEERCTSHVRISEELPCTEISYAMDSEVTMCIENLPDKEKAMDNFTSKKLAVVVKNIQSDCQPNKVDKQLPKDEKEDSGPNTNNFHVLFICKTCQKNYKHKSSLQRHIKNSSHVQSDNLKIMCSKAESLQPEFNTSDTKVIVIANKNLQDEVISQGPSSVKFYEPKSKGQSLLSLENKRPCHLDNCLDQCYSKVSKSNANDEFKTPNKKLQCGNCLRNFKHSYSLKRHCLNLVCTSGSKRKLDYKCLDFKPDSHKKEGQRLKAEQPFISAGRRIMRIDSPLKSKRSHPVIPAGRRIMRIDSPLKSKSSHPFISAGRRIMRIDSPLKSKRINPFIPAGRRIMKIDSPLKSKGSHPVISAGRRIMRIDSPLKSESNHKCQLCDNSYEACSSLRKHVEKIPSKVHPKTFRSTLQNQDSNGGNAIGHHNEILVTSPSVRNFPLKPYKHYTCENRCASSSFYEKHFNKKTRCSSTNPRDTEIQVTSPLIESLPSKPYKCYRCKKRYTSSMFFVKHLNENSCSSVHECLFCQKKFKNEYVYKQHLEVEKSAILNKSISCVACKTIFCRTADLSLNMVQNSCSQCSFTCSCGYFLIEHGKESECNASMPGDALEERAHISGNGGYNRDGSFHQKTCCHRNFIILGRETNSSGTFDREAMEVSCTLRESASSMGHLVFTEASHENEIAEEGMRNVRNSCTSEIGLLDKDSCKSNGECTMNTSGTKGQTDIFQIDNTTGHTDGTGHSKSDAIRFQDDIRASKSSDNFSIAQIPDMVGREFSSQFNDYHRYDSLSQPQGPVAVTSLSQPQGPVAVPSSSQPQGPLAVPSSSQPQCPVAMTSSSQPQGRVAVPSSLQPLGPVAVPSSSQPQGPVALTSSSQPQGPVVVPSSQPQGLVAVPSSSQPQGPVAMSSLQPQGLVAVPSSSQPQSPVAVPFSSQPQGPVAVPSSSQPQGLVAVPSSSHPQGPVAVPSSSHPQGPVAMPSSSQPQGLVAEPYSSNEMSWGCSPQFINYYGPQFINYNGNSYSPQLQFQVAFPHSINLGSFDYFSQLVNYREVSYRSQNQRQVAVPKLTNVASYNSLQLMNNNCTFYSSQPQGQPADKPDIL